jgi:predicted small secreted protein
MTRNIKILAVLLGSSALLSACNTVQGTMKGASRDINAVTNSVGQSTQTSSSQNRHSRTASSSAPSNTTSYGSTATTNSATRTVSVPSNSSNGSNRAATNSQQNTSDPGNPFSTSASQNNNKSSTY